jgi:hypothetical protein
MQEPSIRASRLAIAGGLIAVIGIGAAGFFVGRSTAPEPEPAAPIVNKAPPPPPDIAPRVTRPLGRAELLDLARRAADAFASGEPMPREIAAARGRDFDLALPFGCAGPSPAASTNGMRWNYDESSRSLHVTAAPVTWRPADLGLDEARFDVAEGFWIARPWSSSDVCPAVDGAPVPSGTDAILLPGQNLAIAQFFPNGEKRDARRDGRAYEITRRIAADTLNASRGFRARLIGKIVNTPGGGPIRCMQPGGIEQQPICLIGVELEEVRIENPQQQDVVASWTIRRTN